MDKMNIFEKTKKIKEALKNAILGKEDTTDFIFHLKKSLNISREEAKKLIKNFNLPSLEASNVITIEKSEVDKREYEYKLNTLHKLCKKYTEYSKNIYNNVYINLEEILAEEMAEVVLLNSQYCNLDLLQDINKEIKKKLKNIFGKSIEIDKGIKLTFTNAYTTSTSYLNDIIYDTIINVATEEIDKKKLNEEIKFIFNILKQLI
jgi:hypothetical protein